MMVNTSQYQLMSVLNAGNNNYGIVGSLPESAILEDFAICWLAYSIAAFCAVSALPTS